MYLDITYTPLLQTTFWAHNPLQILDNTHFAKDLSKQSQTSALRVMLWWCHYVTETPGAKTKVHPHWLHQIGAHPWLRIHGTGALQIRLLLLLYFIIIIIILANSS